MILKYDRTPNKDADHEWVWIDRVQRVIGLGVKDEVKYSENYAWQDTVGEAPFRWYMLLHDGNDCDLLGLGINDSIHAFILSEDGRTADRL
jgi:hypothetical protein